MKLVRRPWFTKEKIRDDLFRITEPYYHYRSRSNIWLVLGRDSNLLIDTGLGLSSLRRYLARFLDKPLTVIATHVHFDHSGGCSEFDRVYIHENEIATLRDPDQELTLTDRKLGFVAEDDFLCVPHDSFDVGKYRLVACPHAQPLVDGDIIDLGDKSFRVLHLPGHSSGSVGLYQRGGREFFSGDVVYDGTLLDQLSDSVVSDYVTSMESLLRLQIETVRPGHYHCFSGNRLRRLATSYIRQKEAPKCPS